MFATPLLTLSSSLGISQHALLSNPDDSIRNASIRNDLSSFYPISSTRMKTTNNKAQIAQKSTSESESSSTPSSSEDMESDVENLINSKETAPAIHDSSLCRIGDYCTEVFPISSELPNNEYETMEEVYLKNTPVKDKPVCPLMQSLQKTDGESDGEETEFYDTPTKISHKKEYLDSKFVSASIPFFECEESKYRHVLGAGFTHNRESRDGTLCYGTQEQPAPESECKVIVRPMPNISCITALENGSFSFKAKSSESNRYLEPPVLETMKFHEINNVEAQVKQNKCSERVFPTKNKQPSEIDESSHSGRKVPLKCIEYVASQVKEASPEILSTLYYILYDRRVACQNVASLDQAKEDILNFCGFPFKIGSPEFEKKRMELENLQYSTLYAVYSVLISNMTKTRSSLVAQLLKFLMKPSVPICMPFSSEYETPVEIPAMKNEIVTAHFPVVKLKRLTPDEIKNAVEVKEKPKERSPPRSEDIVGVCNIPRPITSVIHHGSGSPLKTSPDKNVVGVCNAPRLIPSVVHGSGNPLKTFPTIASRIQKASKIIIFKLHALIFGVRGKTPGSLVKPSKPKDRGKSLELADRNRQRILEFNGFRFNEEKFFERKRQFLERMADRHFLQICKIFFCRFKRYSKQEMIEKILNFLKAPSHDFPRKRRIVAFKYDALVHSVPGTTEVKPTILHRPQAKLKDFEQIRINVESSSPEYLISLNDLLFLKSCDSSEIHQNILEYTAISGHEDSLEFQSRKILLHHMSFPVIQNIAKLLDIPNWQQYTYKEDLARSVLRFLVEMKAVAPEKSYFSMSQNRSGNNFDYNPEKRPHILKFDNYKTSPCKQDLFVPEINCGMPRLSQDALPSTSTSASERFCEKNNLPSEVVVQRISESSYSFFTSSLPEPLTFSDRNSDECIPLYEFVNHPSEEELELTIEGIIKCHGFSITIGELLNKVYNLYQGIKLDYRINFIKCKALKIIQELQRQQISFNRTQE
ncbi:uncharacterized protein TNIN_66732 [Trichonephila inaurata madagascariensis]|uniref:Uncharacterized protein n=1 Tax=Trichonephila inaurata madagascariensis TaxID=2747483 RepID=A0A8X7BW49_9ARAC|nr:uncharacterized protein TNIN_66732 [Trichonephila inaurata madagascariensis]